MKKFLFLVLALSFAAVELGAQPATLRWKLDSPARLGTGQQQASDSVWRFDQMPPGWHVTTASGVLLFDPGQVASGQYSVDTYMHLFPNPSLDGLGLFIGGQGMEGDNSAYLSFLVRRDGSYSITRHAGQNVSVLRAWTRDTSVVAHPGGQEVVANRVRVWVRPDSVVLSINMKPVAALPRSGLSTDGVFGLRVGGKLNVHVASLDFIRHLAPSPAALRPPS